MKKLIVAALAALIFALPVAAQAKGRSFGGGRSFFSGYRSTSSFSPSRSGTSVPSAGSRNAAPTPATGDIGGGTTPPRPPGGGSGWSGGPSPIPGKPPGGYRYTSPPNYAVHGYMPTTSQGSTLNNTWFWMYMFHGHPSSGGTSGNGGSAATAASPAKAVDRAQVEANCKAAAESPDKPADVQVTASDCGDLARLAEAKVKAEEEVTVPEEAPSVTVEEDTGVGAFFMIIGGIIAIVLALMAFRALL